MPIAHEQIRKGERYFRDSEPHGGTYVVSSVGHMVTKDSNSSNWHDAVSYTDDDFTEYVRTITDFGAKFSTYVEPAEDEEAE